MRYCSAPRSVFDRPVAAVLVLAAVFSAARTALADEALLSDAEAPAAVFADADHFDRGEVPSTPELRRKVAARLGDLKPTVWESSYKVATAFAGGKQIGRAIIVEEIGKHRPITLVVGVGEDQKVAGVAVMTYREAYGGEIRSRRFLAQYRGKAAGDPLAPSQDIVNITGATLSARAVGRAVKKAIAVLDEVSSAAAKPSASIDTPSASGPCRVREAHYVMGTILELTVDAPDETAGRRWIRSAVAEARRLDAELSSFDPQSALSRLNGGAGGGAQRVPADLFEVMKISSELAKETGGTFDITVAPLVRLWREAGRAGKGPSPAELAAAKRLVGPDAFRLLPPDAIDVSPGAAIELGGVGKGFAVDRIVALLRGFGVESALVNFGESSIAAIGPPPQEAPWTIWVRHGDVLDGPLALRDTALSTSATFGESERVDGRTIGHIIDPRTGKALERAAQATVLAPSGAEAEAWSKALLVDSRAARRALADRPRVIPVAMLGEPR